MSAVPGQRNTHRGSALIKTAKPMEIWLTSSHITCASGKWLQLPMPPRRWIYMWVCLCVWVFGCKCVCGGGAPAICMFPHSPLSFPGREVFSLSFNTCSKGLFLPILLSLFPSFNFLSLLSDTIFFSHSLPSCSGLDFSSQRAELRQDWRQTTGSVSVLNMLLSPSLAQPSWAHLSLTTGTVTGEHTPHTTHQPSQRR